MSFSNPDVITTQFKYIQEYGLAKEENILFVETMLIYLSNINGTLWNVENAQNIYEYFSAKEEKNDLDDEQSKENLLVAEGSITNLQINLDYLCEDAGKTRVLASQVCIDTLLRLNPKLDTSECTQEKLLHLAMTNPRYRDDISSGFAELIKYCFYINNSLLDDPNIIFSEDEYDSMCMYLGMTLTIIALYPAFVQ